MFNTILGSMRVKISVRPAYLGRALKKLTYESIEFGLIEFYNDIDMNFRRILRYQAKNSEEDMFKYGERPVGISDLKHYFIVYCCGNAVAILVFVVEVVYSKFNK